MSKETKQPFDHQPRKSDDTELVAGVLGATEATDMQELTGGQPKHTEQREAPTDLNLTANEQAATTEVEKSKAEKRRQEYYAWAEDNRGDQKWIDEIFTFKTDGTVTAEGTVYLSDLGIDTLPPRLIGVDVNLHLDNNPITSLKNLPDSVGGDLWLRNIPATSIPEGLNITGDIYLDANQTELIADCQAKGYTIVTN